MAQQTSGSKTMSKKSDNAFGGKKPKNSIGNKTKKGGKAPSRGC